MGVPAIPPTLVLVDDHAAYRACLGDLLRQRGLTVLGEAGDTAALLHWLAAAPALPDLVLMDVQMPGGGPAGLQALVHAHPGLRVLVLSMHDDPAIAAAMLAAGAGGYLLKDDPLDELAEAIHAVAGGARRISRAMPPSQQ
jgi:DNA-binding NarL/FixJ family response regulator